MPHARPALAAADDVAADDVAAAPRPAAAAAGLALLSDTALAARIADLEHELAVHELLHFYAREIVLTVADVLRPPVAPRFRAALLAFAARLVECAVPLGVLPQFRGAPLLVRCPSARAFDLAAKHGRIDVIREICDLDLDQNYSLSGAVEFGQLEIARFLLDLHGRLVVDADAVRGALESGNTAVLDWLLRHKHRLVRGRAAFSRFRLWCAEFGRLALLHAALLHDIGDPLSPAAMDAAARNGHLHMVRYLHETHPHGCTTLAMDDAAANGHLAVLKFLHNNRSEGCTHRAMDLAAANGHLDVVLFLHAYRREGASKDAMDLAAANGHLDVLRFLHSHRPEGCTVRAMDAAAENGHAKVLRFLHANRIEGCTERAMLAAAVNGHIEVFTWLWEETSYPTASVVEMIPAAAAGHFFIIEQYAKHTVDDLTPLLKHALCNGHLFLAMWLVARHRAAPHFDMMELWARERFPECWAWLQAVTASAVVAARKHARPQRVASFPGISASSTPPAAAAFGIGPPAGVGSGAPVGSGAGAGVSGSASAVPRGPRKPVWRTLSQTFRLVA
ncbi:hypothetical protein HK105_203186 [Polyrhizophydium stewartii]|uniref:Ankyrin repeat protein n=1 Tax=Polyrhizophydium stewartii TaxID=2732419 RepID=A0ABR4NC70_9FUNG